MFQSPLTLDQEQALSITARARLSGRPGPRL